MRANKAILTLSIALALGLNFSAAEEPRSDKRNNTIATDINEIRIQTISRALVDLKLSEVALRQVDPVDAQKLSLVLAQQTALEQEIEKITVSALEDEHRRLSDKYGPQHPKMIDLKAEIEAHKAKITPQKV